MTASSAWLLDCGTSLALAVGDHELLTYVEPQQRYRIPGSPVYCSSVVYWQNDFIPVMDVAVLHGQNTDQKTALLGMIAYQLGPMRPVRHLAMPVNVAPEKIEVSDEQACAYGGDIDMSLLKSLALSCFTHAGRAVLVIDIAKLCSVEFRDYVDEFTRPKP